MRSTLYAPRRSRRTRRSGSVGGDTVARQRRDQRASARGGQNPDVRVRCAALRIIGYFAYPEGFEFLARGASDGDERVRDAAIAGLPLFEEPRSIELLIQAAHHETTRTR